MKAAALRVLITVDAVGGVWHYALDLAQGLAARGVHPVLALLGPAPDEGQRRQLRATGIRLIETGLPLDWLSEGAEPVRAASEALMAMARDLSADVIHLNSPTYAAAMPPGVPVVAVTHGCVSTWWDAAHNGEPLAPAYRWHRDLMQQGLRAAARVIAPSASFGSLVAKHYGLPTQPQVVHNGRSLHALPFKAPQDRALTVGRLWDRVKRAEMLNAVAAALPIPFDAAGEVTGPHGERLALQHLNLLGRIDSVALAARLAQRPIFVSAACFEPFGLSVLEAGLAGCALVLSDIPTFRELWDGAALFVSPDDALGFSAAIGTLIAGPGMRQRLGEAAQRRAARYTPGAMADAMLAVYADVAGRREIAQGRSAAA